MRSFSLLIVALALFALNGCQPPPDRGPIGVSVIGKTLLDRSAHTDTGPLDPPAAVLTEATGQGLVRYDAAGQIVAGLAVRWIVSDAGNSLIFRLPDLPMPGVRPIDSTLIARRLRAAAAIGSPNRLRPLLGAISEVDAVTPQVIDIELKAPRPNLIQLLAQPELGLPIGRSGPFTIVRSQGNAAVLRALPDPNADPDHPPAPPAMVWLRGERAGTAVARFVNGRAQLVMGGTFTDLPIARAASLRDGALHIDPTRGLFGLVFARETTGFTADPANRRALAMAINRDRIAKVLAIPSWASTTAIVASGNPEIARPATPDWSGAEIYGLQSQARAVVTRWKQSAGLAPLSVAMPQGPGARLLFALIAADWREIGVTARMAGPSEPADLWLTDVVAPADVASFYLRAFACDQHVPCTELSDRLLVEARDATSLAQRATLLEQADALIMDTVPFIPLGNPIRWSLVAPGLDLYRDNPRSIHPLNELRSPLMR